MYTNQPIRLHSKCLAILELIQKVNNRMEELRLGSELYDRSTYMDAIRFWNTRESFDRDISHTKAVQERLERSYYATLVKIIANSKIANATHWIGFEETVKKYKHENTI